MRTVLLRTLGAALALAWLVAMMMPAPASGTGANAMRIVAIGGSVTEIVFALGEGGRVVGRDTTSVYPPESAPVPEVGYIRAISPEGVLSVNPDLIVALEGSGPPEAVTVLKESGVPFVTIPEGYDGAAIVAKILATGEAIGVPAKARELADEAAARLKAAQAGSAGLMERRKVLFVLSLREGRVMAAGSDTHADGMIAMAGGINAMGGMSGYKQVSDEAIIEAAPDVILVMDRRDDHAAEDDEIAAHPALGATPAGRNRRIIRMDGLYLLGFGPRTADAVSDLHADLYPASEKPAN
ncbi:MAG: hemin ABC transporter substrate-binding protein [Flavobacteriaceae bacterium]